MRLNRLIFKFLALIQLVAWGQLTPSQVAHNTMLAVGQSDRSVQNFLPFGTNIPGVIRGLDPYLLALNLSIEQLQPPALSRVYSVEYLHDEAVDHSAPKNLKRFKELIVAAFDGTQKINYQGLVSDLQALIQADAKGFLFSGKIPSRNFFLLIPFIYKSDGTPLYSSYEDARRESLIAIDSMTADQLRHLYLRPQALQSNSISPLNPIFDLIYEGESRFDRFPILHQLLENFRDIFIERDIMTYTYYNPTSGPNQRRSKVKPSFFALHETSPLEALLRGEWAGDCATEYAEQHFAATLSQQGGLGLADLISKGLRRDA